MAEKVCLLAVPTDLVWDSKHDPETLKSVDFWFKLSSPFVVAEPQERCFELFRVQNSHNFLELCPWNPLGGASSTPLPPPLPQTPQLHNSFSPCYARQKTGTPKKLLDTALTRLKLQTQNQQHTGKK